MRFGLSFTRKSVRFRKSGASVAETKNCGWLNALSSSAENCRRKLSCLNTSL